MQGLFGTDSKSVWVYRLPCLVLCALSDLAFPISLPDRETVATRYESLSEQFFDQMSLITAEKPWMVSPGNHEGKLGLSQSNFALVGAAPSRRLLIRFACSANCNNGGYSSETAPNNITADYCFEGQTNFVRCTRLAVSTGKLRR